MSPLVHLMGYRGPYVPSAGLAPERSPLAKFRPETRRCVVCGEEHFARQANKRYCSKRCAYKSWNVMRGPRGQR